MHDYIVGGLARGHQDDLLREVLHEELIEEARQARDATASNGRAGAGAHRGPRLVARLHVLRADARRPHVPRLHGPRLHGLHLRVAHRH